MILLVIFFGQTLQISRPKLPSPYHLSAKYFCYPVGMWLRTNLETKLHFVLNINVGTRAIKVTHITWEFCIPKALAHCEWLTLIRSTFPIMRVTLTPDSAVHDICILILGYTRFLRLLNGSFRFFLSWKSLISKKSRLLRNEILSQMCYFLVI